MYFSVASKLRLIASVARFTRVIMTGCLVATGLIDGDSPSGLIDGDSPSGLVDGE